MRWQVAHHIRKDSDIVVEYRRRLDSIREWTPFRLNVARDVDKTVHHGTIRWMYMVEPYMPDRVLRQFGFIQIIPAPPIFPLRGVKSERRLASYKVNYEPGDQAWGIPHVHMFDRAYYGRWARPTWETDSDYLAWYLHHTLPRIDPSVEPVERAEPSATILLRSLASADYSRILCHTR